MPSEPDILVVEAEQKLIKDYSLALNESFNITIVTNGQNAINHIKSSKKVDIAIINYKLPDMSGIAVLKEIKKLRSSLPIIIATANGDEDIVVKTFRCGGKDYLKLPFNRFELIKAIRFYLSLKLQGRNGQRETFFLDVQGSLGSSLKSDSLYHNYYKIQKAVRYIDANYMSKISLSIVANEACLSKYHFSKIFKKIMQVSYQDYLAHFRIEKAKEILKNTNLSITDTAFSVGYNDLTHFERVFKKITRSSPSQYCARQEFMIPKSEKIG